MVGCLETVFVVIEAFFTILEMGEILMLGFNLEELSILVEDDDIVLSGDLSILVGFLTIVLDTIGFILTSLVFSGELGFTSPVAFGFKGDDIDLMSGDPDLIGDDIDLTDDEANLIGDEIDLGDDDETDLIGDDIDLIDVEVNLIGDDIDLTGDDADLIGDDIDLAGDDADLTGDDIGLTRDDADLTGDELFLATGFGLAAVFKAAGAEFAFVLPTGRGVTFFGPLRGFFSGVFSVVIGLTMLRIGDLASATGLFNAGETVLAVELTLGFIPVDFGGDFSTLLGDFSARIGDFVSIDVAFILIGEAGAVGFFNDELTSTGFLAIGDDFPVRLDAGILPTGEAFTGVGKVFTRVISWMDYSK